ncbi:Gfo/Idh/MocA family protein [Paenibacillus silvisoli]|uniref:Gfo/Idh/MocA family protein n=1 Tax=Paenibacillus silvisoli TaxID=3110539 RepID=UPI002803AC73|nr:Gfo/Idh/MocA family oxidoreductase [Paenibacillus silvisoli]
MTQTIRVGIAGTGMMGQIHAKHLLNIPGVEVTAACGTTIEKAEAFCAAHTGGAARAYEDFNAMLDGETLDAVYICLPPYAHHGQVEAAARKGAAVFIEKPIALNTDIAGRMVTAIEEAGVVSQVGYHNRFGAAVLELKRLIDDGTAGVPTLFDGRYDCNSLHSPWWRDRSLSGGQVFEQAIHTYDLAMLFLGTPERVTGYTANLNHQEAEGYTVEDTSAAVIRFASGAMASITASNNAVPGEWNSSFTIICTKLTAHFKGSNKAEFIFTGGAEPVRREIDAELDVYAAETDAFIAALRGEGAEVCPIREGLRSLRLVEQVMRSADENGKQLNYE